MFGYVKPFKPELKMLEFDFYKGVYCSLCKTLGKKYGILARMTLNYDFSFLALFHMAFAPNCMGFGQMRCVYRPWKKCPCCKGGGQSLDFAAAASVLMVYHKLKDNVKDKPFLQSVPSRILLPASKGMVKKAARDYPEIDEAVKMLTSSQNAVEDEKNTSIDKAAEPTAKLISFLSSLASGDKHEQQALSRFGYCMGRWIYLIDAADDLEDDLRSGGYNPFVLSLGVTGDGASIANAKEAAGQVIERTLASAAVAFEEIHPKRFNSILENIIYLGLPAVQKQVIGLNTTKESIK